MQAFLVNGVRKAKPRFSISLFQPLTPVELVMYIKQTTSLRRLKEIQYSEIFKDIPSNPVKSSVALFISEILYRSLHDSDCQKDLFDFTMRSLSCFDLLTDSYSSFHHFFLVRLMRYLGFYPNADSYSPGFVFNLISGSYHAAGLSGPYYSNSETASLLYRFQQSEIDNFTSIQMTALQKSTLLQTLIDYYSYHLPNPIHIRSYEVLQEVFEK